MADDAEETATLLSRERNLESLGGLADRFGDRLTHAFARGAVEGKRFDETLDRVRRTLLQLALRSALQPLQRSLTSGLGALLGGGEGAAFAKGGVLSAGRVTPFAQGGVVAAPTYFPMQRGLGLMGEAGPEAILPLARGPDGRLGVAAGGSGRGVSVVVNISTPDPEGFRRSETQVAAALARAVARGQRGL